ncbi:MAG: hypothetical protein A2X61_15750 [Ignavibacteria bacterium GWB2_35_12]|nr:MAG: hypothetical protein A2X63_10715 [Ignavibacteria bacterium GWA2_35_8]OGU40829.1 MAG: hypothetical protein A2X61_15750 [Ignavibacteria bacterium GWB2_35_12]OGU87121.1 MAG: hypothetical protein A2220_08125 [Ignavibacteria bacterium RIFOXYA2_FULL_35_10]OGV24656.1 MAG: hypothetical protein A2475_14525 [Ignavibacteria bacterium RIFOXYC2_FULL_35_21]
MAGYNKGQAFLDKKATNLDGTKGKYFIALSSAEYDDDDIICFVMNTERRMDLYHPLCNREKGKFIIKPNTFSFIKDYTSIMLKMEVYYKLTEMYEYNIILYETADELLLRQIKNCIDFNYILEKVFA